MHTLTRIMAQGYDPGAPSREAEQIDAQMAERHPCPACGGPMHYEGFHRSRNGRLEYIALAVCNNCGHEVAF